MLLEWFWFSNNSVVTVPCEKCKARSPHFVSPRLEVLRGASTATWWARCGQGGHLTPRPRPFPSHPATPWALRQVWGLYLVNSRRCSCLLLCFCQSRETGMKLLATSVDVASADSAVVVGAPAAPFPAERVWFCRALQCRGLACRRGAARASHAALGSGQAAPHSPLCVFGPHV